MSKSTAFGATWKSTRREQFLGSTPTRMVIMRSDRGRLAWACDSRAAHITRQTTWTRVAYGDRFS